MRSLMLTVIAAGAIWSAVAVTAQENIRFEVSGPDKTLESELRTASLVLSTISDERTGTRDLLSAALSDYGRLLETLYANGHYSGVIQIKVNGQEAATIPLLAVPGQINSIAIRVNPGPPFRFSQARIAPLPPGTVLSPDFKAGKPAQSVVIRDAVETSVEAWREQGHAKAAPVGQNIVADHAKATLSADVQLNPGPKVRFGNLRIITPSAVRDERIRRIAGLPGGEEFSPETLRRMAERLRRVAAFSSVSIEEANTLGPGDTLDINLALADRKPRRFGFGAEVSSLDGLDLSAFWLHRNAFGGAELLRFDGAVGNIGGQTGGIDYSAGARIDIPAVLGPDTTVFTTLTFDHLDEATFISDRISVGGGATWYATNELKLEAGASYSYSQTEDAFGDRNFSLLSFPASLTLDKRDEPLDPKSGYFVNAQATPYAGFAGSASGARICVDGRAYRGIGTDDRVVLAGRLQFGGVLGSGITETHPDFLFYSGGGGTVRGQPYQSLDVDLGGGTRSGGRSFLGLSFEARADITDTIGAVAFADAGYVGAESIFDGSGNWHSGVGLGVRYKTGLGPIRFDVAVPVEGGTGSGVQIYLGIGQSF